jgi:hypothetical protein
VNFEILVKSVASGRPLTANFHQTARPSVDFRETTCRRANLDIMLTQADRAAERRREKMKEIARQVKDGSLKIRKMTRDERRRYPAVPPKARRK